MQINAYRLGSITVHHGWVARSDGSDRNLSWRVRVPHQCRQTANGETLTSALSVVQVRSASYRALSWRPMQRPSLKPTQLAAVYPFFASQSFSPMLNSVTLNN